MLSGNPFQTAYLSGVGIFSTAFEFYGAIRVPPVPLVAQIRTCGVLRAAGWLRPAYANSDAVHHVAGTDQKRPADKRSSIAKLDSAF
jgi:hypothetical protein